MSTKLLVKQELAETLIEAVHQVMHGFRSRQYEVLTGGAVEITHMENKVLGFFTRNPGASQSEFVEASGRDKAQVARLIKQLREQGLLEMSVDEKDRRQQKLTVTSQGRSLYEKLKRAEKALCSKAVEGLDDVQAQLVVELLAKIQRNLTASN